MHYFFVDESYRGDAGLQRITVACWGVEQGRLNRQDDLLSVFFRPPIEKQIASGLKRLNAIAVVASARLDKSLWRRGEIDATDDVPAMARTDNAWSMSVVFAVATLILEFVRSNQSLDTVDIYFDSKSLKRQHVEALEKTIRHLVVTEAKRFERQFGIGRQRRLKIRRIEPVEKPKDDHPADKFQIGTRIAHILCSKGARMASGPSDQIKTRDMSDEIRRTLQQFDGKSFYDG